MAINVDSIENDPEESALMETINIADLKQKLAQNINLSIKNNAKHLKVHVSGPFQNKKMARIIGLLCLVIMDKCG